MLAEPPGRPWRRAVSAGDLSALDASAKAEGGAAPARPGPGAVGKGGGGGGGGGGDWGRDRLPEGAGDSSRRRWLATVLPPSYALLAHHARAAGLHLKAAAYYLASAKQSSLDLCIRNGLVGP